MRFSPASDVIDSRRDNVYVDRLMGNERSALRGLEIEDKAVEVTDYWMHYDATVHDSSLQRLSIFISEPSLHFTATFGKPSPLERAAKVNIYSLLNILLNRHTVECSPNYFDKH